MGWLVDGVWMGMGSFWVHVVVDDRDVGTYVGPPRTCTSNAKKQAGAKAEAALTDLDASAERKRGKRKESKLA